MSKIPIADAFRGTAEYCLQKHKDGEMTTESALDVLAAAMSQSIEAVIKAMIADGVLKHTGKGLQKK